MAWDDGTRAIAATAHQNPRWPGVTPATIQHATSELDRRLIDQGIPLSVYPTAEVMVGPDTEVDLQAGRLTTVSDQGCYLLIELPAGLFLDLRELVTNIAEAGVRPILAHPERHPELLHGEDTINELIRRGCLVQVSAASITQRCYPQLTSGLKQWVKRGIVHLIGSDGHSPQNRPPGISAAYERLAEWADWGLADRVCSGNGMAVLEGLPLEIPRPLPARRSWFSRRQHIRTHMMSHNNPFTTESV